FALSTFAKEARAHSELPPLAKGRAGVGSVFDGWVLMNVACGHLDAEQLETLFAGVLEALPGPLLLALIRLEPPVAVIQIDAAPQSLAPVAAPGVPDRAIDEH